jgi:hypothetical protein
MAAGRIVRPKSAAMAFMTLQSSATTGIEFRWMGAHPTALLSRAETETSMRAKIATMTIECPATAVDGTAHQRSVEMAFVTSEKNVTMETSHPEMVAPRSV